MKKLIFALVFCCLAGAGYAQEFTVKNMPGADDWFLYTDKKFEKQVFPAPTFTTHIKRAGEIWVSRCETYLQQLADRLPSPKMHKMLKELKEKHKDKCINMNIYFDETGKVITSQFVIPKELSDTFTEKYIKELYHRVQKEVIDLTIFRFDNRAELCYINLSLPGPATKGKP